MAHTSINPWTLNSWKNDACSIAINDVICGKPPSRAKKSRNLQKKKVNNLETRGDVQKKNATLLTIVEKFVVCHPKIGRVHTQKVAMKSTDLLPAKKHN